MSPEHGMKWMSFLGLKPTFFRKGTSFSLHSSYLQGSSEHSENNGPQHTNTGSGERPPENKHGDASARCQSAPLQAPVDGGVVHLVDQDDEMFDPSRLGQHGVLPRLAALFKARLKLPLPG